MGPGHHEGRSGVSVKPPLPVSPAAQPRACQEFLVTFVSQTKVTRPSACEASGAKPLLTSGTLASARENCRAGRAKPLLILETLASASTNSQQAGRSHINLQRILRQQNRAFNRTLAVSRKTGPPAAARGAKTQPRAASFDHRPPHGNISDAAFGDFFGRVEVAAVDDAGGFQLAFEPVEINRAKLFPFGADDQRVGAGYGLFTAVAQGDAGLVFPQGAGGRCGGRVVGLDAGAGAHQRVDEGAAGGFAHVVGAGFEGQAPNGDGGALQLTAECAVELVEQLLFLAVVDVFNGLQYFGGVASLGGNLPQGVDVLGKARAAVAAAGIQE